MSETEMHLDARDVPAEWIPRGYKGRKFRAVITDRVEIADSQLQWDGGSRAEYAVIDAGRLVPVVPVKRWPEHGRQVIELKPGRVVRQHSIFCGKDMGLTFYCVAQDVNPSRLEAPAAELTDTDKLVLNATRAYKSSYAGQTRRDMVNRDLECRARVRGERFEAISVAAWSESVAKLQDLGLLDKRGAITNKGRNAS